MKRIAAPVVGVIVTITLLTLLVIPGDLLALQQRELLRRVSDEGAS